MADKVSPVNLRDGPHFRTPGIDFRSDDVFLVFSDGFADQFGGDSGKKITRKGFRAMVMELENRPMMEWEQELRIRFEFWKGSREQVDDVCVIEFRR